MPKLFKLKPFSSVKVWGGPRLQELKNITSDEPIGETWEVSTHADGLSHIEETGEPLNKFFGLSYLVKFIDAGANLSIQVHPDDDYAKEYENSRGKTECWVILDAQEGAGIYLGFKPGITRKEFFNAVESGLPCDKFLNFIPVKKGDFFYLPPGSVHALGDGVTMCEVQQSSGITYRVWDWNRLGMDGKPRELHIEKAKDVLNFQESFNQGLLERARKSLLDTSGIATIAEHEDFKVELFSKMRAGDIELNLTPAQSIIVLEGELESLKTMQAAIAMEEGNYLLKAPGEVSFLVVSGKIA